MRRLGDRQFTTWHLMAAVAIAAGPISIVSSMPALFSVLLLVLAAFIAAAILFARMATRPRFSPLTLLIAVAAVGVTIGGEKIRWRLEDFRSQASLLSVKERSATREASMADRNVAVYIRRADRWRSRGDAEFARIVSDRAEWWAGIASRHRRRAAYYASRRSKYERAASRPWLAVPPDPPLPE
jgi:hypothetical protein